MTRTTILLFFSLIQVAIHAQTPASKLAAAFKTFEADPQLSSGIASLCVVDARTGTVVFQRNAMLGLAPASTQKVITSASAYMLLGKEFLYRTRFGFAPPQAGASPGGYLFIEPSGDPTLGSWRWPEKGEAAVLGRVAGAAKKFGVTPNTPLRVRDSGFIGETIPDGWIWQDIGNYYGAGASAFNWRENQYDILLRSGSKTGTAVDVSGTVPRTVSFPVTSHVVAAAKGTGDNAYIYYPLLESGAVVRGTIPVDEKAFVVSGALPNPSKEFIAALVPLLAAAAPAPSAILPRVETIFHTEVSPPLDTIIYWFNKKSINLYGEALVKTIAISGNCPGTTGAGIDLIKKLWTPLGIQSTELNIVDGSGLSPLNRVTTHAQVTVLAHARKQPWFNGFFKALPEYNGMKMKSGTITGAKGFCGYHRSKAGAEYVFSFLVNNYNGSAKEVVGKMYHVLDLLK